jgi:REP element-mobilizing transposase RayT
MVDMANTYTQFNIHAVFAVKGRQNLLVDKFRIELFQYIHGILKNRGQYPLAVNGYKDHVHIFFELHPSSCISDIMRDVKASASKWINENKFVVGNFSWQEGYGGFSYSRTQRDNVINYIMDQEKHHSTHSFQEEYLELLRKYQIEFKNEYVFEFYE